MKPLALTLEKESTHTLRNKIRLPLDVSKGKSSWLTKAIFTLEKNMILQSQEKKVTKIEHKSQETEAEKFDTGSAA